MPDRRPSPAGWTPTGRQRLVLGAAVLHGRKEAAHRLEISQDTVKHTLDAMRRGSGVGSVEQLVYVGVTRGWLRIPELEGMA